MKFKLSALRTNAGLTQSQLADKVGVTSVTICMWENGKAIPRLDLAVKTCKILNCIVEDVEEFNYESQRFSQLLAVWLVSNYRSLVSVQGDVYMFCLMKAKMLPTFQE